MIKTFEQYNDKKYAITTILFDELHVLAYFPSKNEKFVGWKPVNNLGLNIIELYTYNDAISQCELMLKAYPNSVHDIMTLNQLEVKMNANRYNL
jgi:hypothetical protein